MTNPAPGYKVTTAYGVKGSWSCGFHTGVDIACPTGTRLVAAIAGEIRHRSYGSALGNHQFAISPDPGQPFAEGEAFYAHTRTRLPDGTRVNVGDYVAECGVEGNTTGPHLHFEYHPEQKNSWGCNVCANPQPLLDYQSEDDDIMAGKLITFFQKGGIVYEADLSGGTFRRILNPQDLTDRKHVLTTAGIPWFEWTPGKDVQNVEAFGRPV